MPGNVKPEITRQREVDMWKLRQLGWTQQRIADKLEIDQSTVSVALARISKRVLADLGDAVQAVKAEQAGQLDHIIDESLQAWDRSKEATRNVRRRQVQPAMAQGDGTAPQASQATPSEVTQEVKDQDGSVTYLETAMKAMADKRKIFGADAPLKIAETDLTGQNAPRSTDDIAREIARILASNGKAKSKRSS